MRTFKTAVEFAVPMATIAAWVAAAAVGIAAMATQPVQAARLSIAPEAADARVAVRPCPDRVL